MPIELLQRTEEQYGKLVKFDVGNITVLTKHRVNHSADAVAGNGETVGTEDEPNMVRYIASVFNVVNSYGTFLVYGAFRNATPETVKGLWQHNRDEPIGKVLEIKELPPYHELLPNDIKQFGGLYIKEWFNPDVQRGRETYSNIINGVLTDYSIGFIPIEQKLDEEMQAEAIFLVDLWEVSPVTFGANPMTSTITNTVAHTADTEIVQHAGAKFSKTTASDFHTRASALKAHGESLIVVGNECVAHAEAILADVDKYLKQNDAETDSETSTDEANDEHSSEVEQEQLALKARQILAKHYSQSLNVSA